MSSFKHAIAIFFVILLLVSTPAHAVITCSGDIASALNSAITSAAVGGTVEIGAGSCSMGSTVSISKKVTIKGQGTKDSAVTTIAATTERSNFIINNVGARITGIAFAYNSTDSTKSGNNAVKPIGGANGNQWRIDNCRFTNVQTNSLYAIAPLHYSATARGAGLIDNNYFRDVRVVFLGSSVFAIANAIWAAEPGFGTSGGTNNIYLEDNTFERTVTGNSIDANYSGQFVSRFNYYLNTEVMVHSYQLLSSRGSRSWEIYNDTFYAPSSVAYFPFFIRSGEGMVFNISISGSGYNTTKIVYDSRRAYDSVAGGLCDGDHPADENTAGENGWLCRDQIGAGTDVTLTTGTGDSTVWAAQANRPAYSWNNGTWAIGLQGDTTLHMERNRDYYDNGAYGVQTSSSSPFNGTKASDKPGVGFGTYANRPSTCTTGVAYWATDHGGNWNTLNTSSNDGALYKCTSTNTWTLSYTPLVYPHPLRSGVVADDTSSPVITNTTPANFVCDAASPLDSLTMTVTTNESIGANCSWSDADVAYASMTPFTTTGGNAHSTALTALACDASYTRYVRCQDRAPAQNTNTTSTSVAFAIGAEAAPGGDTTPPTLSGALPNLTTLLCTENPRSVQLFVHAEDETTPITAKYSTTDVAYASMAGTFDTTGGVPVKTIDDYYSESNYDTSLNMYTGQSSAVGQSFTSTGGELNSAAFFLSKTGAPTGNAVVKIYAHTGTYGTSSLPTGSALAASDNFDVSTLGTSIALTEIAFSGANRITLESATNYVVTFEWSGGDSSNYVTIARDATPEHSGNAVGYIASAWATYPTRDTVFYVYVMNASSNDFSKTVSLPCGANYVYYYRASDGTNASTESTTATFSIASAIPEAVYQFEDCTLADPMAAVADVTASGGYYVGTTTEMAGTATCVVSAPSSGTYRIIARTMAADTGSDSVFLTVGSESQITWTLNVGPDAADWNVWNVANVNAIGIGNVANPQYDPYQVAMSSGNNTLVFTGREVGAKLDYFYIEKVAEIPTLPNVGGSQLVGVSGSIAVGNDSGTKMIIP